jgi:Zn finger protein HypA/HybF involved in hydrogenase expression
VNLNLKSEIVGESCYCYNCNLYSNVGEVQEKTVLINDYDFDNYGVDGELKYKCPKCGSEDTEFQLHIKISA